MADEIIPDPNATTVKPPPHPVTAKSTAPCPHCPDAPGWDASRPDLGRACPYCGGCGHVEAKA
jgi:hypothetical protein